MIKDRGGEEGKGKGKKIYHYRVLKEGQHLSLARGLMS